MGDAVFLDCPRETAATLDYPHKMACHALFGHKRPSGYSGLYLDFPEPGNRPPPGHVLLKWHAH